MKPMPGARGQARLLRAVRDKFWLTTSKTKTVELYIKRSLILRHSLEFFVSILSFQTFDSLCTVELKFAGGSQESAPESAPRFNAVPPCVVNKKSDDEGNRQKND